MKEDEELYSPCKRDYTRSVVSALFDYENLDELTDVIITIHNLEMMYGVYINTEKLIKKCDADLRVMKEWLELIEEELIKENE
jgi:hypothetical protein